MTYSSMYGIPEVSDSCNQKKTCYNSVNTSTTSTMYPHFKSKFKFKFHPAQTKAKTSIFIAAMASSKRCRSEVTNGKVDLDPDLICPVCTELVVDARQAGCCGNIYCKDCIGDWLARNKPGSCPSCRAALTVSKLLIDKRSERQSADHPRNCKFFEPHGCKYIGDRKAVDDHQQCCSFNPDVCKNAYCRTLHALEVDRQRKGKADETLNQKKLILANIWKKPEDALKSLFDLHVVRLYTASAVGLAGKYTQNFNRGVNNYTCVIDCAHHNVSIMFAADQTVSYNNGLRFVLIHPTDPSLNHSIDIFLPSAECTVMRGNLNWMTEEKFRSFVMNGKFAFGLRSIPYVPQTTTPAVL